MGTCFIYLFIYDRRPDQFAHILIKSMDLKSKTRENSPVVPRFRIFSLRKIQTCDLVKNKLFLLFRFHWAKLRGCVWRDEGNWKESVDP